MSEPKLKYKDARVVEYRDLDEFVNMHLEGFGLPRWTIMETGYDGYSNGSYESVEVEYGLDVEDSYDQDFDRWLMGGNFYEPEGNDSKYFLRDPFARHVMQWLCNMGFIEEGNYVIHIWW